MIVTPPITDLSKGKVCLLSPNKETQTPTSDVLSWLTGAIDESFQSQKQSEFSHPCDSPHDVSELLPNTRLKIEKQTLQTMTHRWPKAVVHLSAKHLIDLDSPREEQHTPPFEDHYSSPLHKFGLGIPPGFSMNSQGSTAPWI